MVRQPIWVALLGCVCASNTCQTDECPDEVAMIQMQNRHALKTTDVTTEADPMDVTFGVEEFDPDNNGCPSGYFLRSGWKLGSYGGCPGSPRSAHCILPTGSATQFCDADPDCTGISWTTNPGWRGAFPGGSQIGGGSPYGTHSQWHSCVKNQVFDPDIDLCPTGYTLQSGWKLGSFGGCPGSPRSAHCILPIQSATQFCEANPDCTGISWTTNPGWRGAFPGLAQLGGGAPYGAHNQWHSCTKDIDLEDFLEEIQD